MVPPDYLKRFCLKGQGAQTGQLLIDRTCAPSVRFEQANLMQPLPGWLPQFDVIFLRNVLIYFDNEAKAQIVRTRAHAAQARGRALHRPRRVTGQPGPAAAHPDHCRCTPMRKPPGLRGRLAAELLGDTPLRLTPRPRIPAVHHAAATPTAAEAARSSGSRDAAVQRLPADQAGGRLPADAPVSATSSPPGRWPTSSRPARWALPADPAGDFQPSRLAPGAAPAVLRRAASAPADRHHPGQCTWPLAGARHAGAEPGADARPDAPGPGMWPACARCWAHAWPSRCGTRSSASAACATSCCPSAHTPRPATRPTAAMATRPWPRWCAP